MTDLTDRMRTCEAFLRGISPEQNHLNADIFIAICDAADLLIEASNALEAAPAPLGEPMEILPPMSPSAKLDAAITAHFDAPPQPPFKPDPIMRGYELLMGKEQRQQYEQSKACPKCDSRVAKRVHLLKKEKRIMLTCPVCDTKWQYKGPQERWG